MCFTAITAQYLSRIESAEGESPAFDALYGVCSFETSSVQLGACKMGALPEVR